jgi:hypothetical protein
MEENPLEGLRILAAGSVDIANVLQNTITAQSRPGTTSRSILVPPYSSNDVLDKSMAAIEIVGLTSGVPKPAETRKKNLLVVSVNSFVSCITLPCPNICGTCLVCDVEAINKLALCICHVAF